MRFTVFSFAPVPDIDTARRNFGLQDLSDADVAKVLFHQRKQKTGHSEQLNWDQLQIASLTLVHHSLDYVQMDSYSLAQNQESDLIDWVHKAISRSGRVITWGGAQLEEPLLHFRCMKHRISYTPYWTARQAGEQVHLDIRRLLQVEETAPDLRLDDLARRFDLPGMLGQSSDQLTDAWLADDSETLARYADYRALNTYLLALEVLSLRGEISYADRARAQKKLRDYLNNEAKPRARYADFLATWNNPK